ncbi:hypothetical protein D3C81_2276860 [compost metagenome]
MMVSNEEGPNFAIAVTSMPAQPATCQPTRLTIIMFGPGAAWLNANKALNSFAVIH